MDNDPSKPARDDRRGEDRRKKQTPLTHEDRRKVERRSGEDRRKGPRK